MPDAPSRPILRPRRGPRVAAWLLGVALLVAVGWMVVTVGSPLPTTHLAMATGPAGSGAAAIGLRYREILKRSGVNLRLVETAGGFANVAQLKDRATGISVALVESGVTSRTESPDLVALGAVSLEPLWIFTRERMRGTPAERFTGRRVATAPEGSGSYFLARRLLALNGVPDSSVAFASLTPEAGAEALLRGEVDIAIMLTPWQAPALQRLLSSDRVVLEGFPRAEAYVARFPALSRVVLPQGVADLARDLPPADVPLLAVESNLVARRDLHPALQYLFLEAAAEIHGGPDVFSRAGRFPGPGSLDLPLSDQARTFYKSGRPFVYRYLPFWAAALVERLLFILIPLLAVVLPLANVLPKLYEFVTQRRIFSFYRELREIELLLASPGPAVPLDQLAGALADLDHRATGLKVPLGFAQRRFILKSHIALAREEVERRRGAQALGGGPVTPS